MPITIQPKQKMVHKPKKKKLLRIRTIDAVVNDINNSFYRTYNPKVIKADKGLMNRSTF